jgi:hypothetical protein
MHIKKRNHSYKHAKKKKVLTAIFSMGLVVLLILLFVMENPLHIRQSAAATNILWSTNHESGTLSDWYLNDCGGEFNSGNGVSSASTDVAHSGKYSAKMTINATGSDTGVRLFRWCESRASDPALYYSTWYYFPTQVQVTGGWWNIFQFKSKYAGGNDPYWIVNVGNRSNGDMYLYLYDWVHKKGYDQSIASLPVGKWVNIKVFLKRAADNTGQISVWQDGVEIFNIPNVPTVDANAELQWSIDNYANELSPSDVTIYTDDATITTSSTEPDITPSPQKSSPKPTPDDTADFLKLLKLIMSFL